MVLDSSSRKVPEGAGGITYEGMEITVPCDVGLQVSFGITTKYRQRAIYGELRQKIGGIIRDLCRQKSIELLDSKDIQIIK